MKKILNRTALVITIMLSALGCSNSSEKQKVQIRIVHNPEIREVLQNLKNQFISSKKNLSGDIDVDIQLIPEIGQKVASKISSGAIKPHYWIAPGGAIVQLTNSTSSGINTEFESCPLLFASPVVVGVDERYLSEIGEVVEGSTISMRRLLNDAAKNNTVLDVADPEGAPSGLAIINQLLSSAGKLSGSEQEDASLESDRLTSIRKQLGRAVSNEDLILTRASSSTSTNRPGTIRLALTSEFKIFNFNSKQANTRSKLKALYPKEGSAWIKYLGCPAKGDWINNYEQAAIKIWADFLNEETNKPELLNAFGLRDKTGVLLQNAGINTGIEPSIPNTPLDELSGDEVTKGLAQWRAISMGDRVIFILDTWRTLNKTTQISLGTAMEAILEKLPSFLKFTLLTNEESPTIISPTYEERTTIGKTIASFNSPLSESLMPAIEKSIDDPTLQDSAPSRRVILVITDGDRGSGGNGFSTARADAIKKILNDDALFVVVNFGDKNKDASELISFTQDVNGVYENTSLNNLSAAIVKALEYAY